MKRATKLRHSPWNRSSPDQSTSQLYTTAGVVPDHPGGREAVGRIRSARRTDQPTFTTILPVLPPPNMSRKASTVCSKPSTTVSS